MHGYLQSCHTYADVTTEMMESLRQLSNKICSYKTMRGVSTTWIHHKTHTQ